MHFYTWQKGLKTGIYYLRSKAAAQAVQFTVSDEKKDEPTAVEEEILEGAVCTMEEGCISCGS
jgi:ribonucleoside-diphosphate reductase alpha chain